MAVHGGVTINVQLVGGTINEIFLWENIEDIRTVALNIVRNSMEQGQWDDLSPNYLISRVTFAEKYGNIVPASSKLSPWRIRFVVILYGLLTLLAVLLYVMVLPRMRKHGDRKAYLQDEVPNAPLARTMAIDSMHNVWRKSWTSADYSRCLTQNELDSDMDSDSLPSRETGYKSHLDLGGNLFLELTIHHSKNGASMCSSDSNTDTTCMYLASSDDEINLETPLDQDFKFGPRENTAYNWNQCKKRKRPWIDEEPQRDGKMRKKKAQLSLPYYYYYDNFKFRSR